jgi:hypothetical protein
MDKEVAMSELLAVCPECGKLFSSGVYLGNEEFCSAECVSEWLVSEAERKLESTLDEVMISRYRMRP